MRPRCLLAAAFAAALPTLADAQSFTPGNIVACAGGFLYELDRDLRTVRSLRVPTPAGLSVDVTDVVVDRRGRAHVLETGVGAPGAIATYDPLTNLWTLTQVQSFLGNISDGDIALLGEQLFTKSQRFDLPGFQATPITIGASEISAGLDGRLFALDSGSPRSQIRVVDPVALTVVDTFSVPFLSDVRGIGSLPNGELLVADWDGTIKRYTPRGETRLASLTTGVFNLVDIAVGVDGAVVAGGRSGDVLLTDASLGAVRSRRLQSGLVGAYTGFVPPLGPEVDAVDPAGGSWRRARTVEIRGRFFTGAPAPTVRFGGVAATDVVVVTDALLRCTAPAGAPGPVDVELANVLGATTLPNGYVYTPGLVAASTVAPGAMLTLDLRLEAAGDFVVALVGLPDGPRGTIPGIDGERAIGDPTVLFLAPFWPGASLPLSIPVPDLPSLVGVRVGFQAASGMVGRATWTNAAIVEVR